MRGFFSPQRFLFDTPLSRVWILRTILLNSVTFLSTPALSSNRRRALLCAFGLTATCAVAVAQTGPGGSQGAQHTLAPISTSSTGRNTTGSLAGAAITKKPSASRGAGGRIAVPTKTTAAFTPAETRKVEQKTESMFSSGAKDSSGITLRPFDANKLAPSYTGFTTLSSVLLSTPVVPPVPYTETSQSLVNSSNSILNLDTDFTSNVVENDKYKLPDQPLPTEELDKLSSGSPGAKHMRLISAICRALELNQNLRVEKLRPEITNTGIESEEGAFDTTLNAALTQSSSHNSTLGPRNKDGSPRSPESDAVSRNTNLDVSLSGRLPTGTDYSLGFSANRNTTNRTLPFYTEAANLNITQNLLRGAGCAVNLVRVWTAENNFVISLYQLQQVLIDLVSDVQNSYWDLYLATETLRIRITAYEVAKDQRLRSEELVRVGKSPPLDVLASQAEESSRISDVIVAATNLKQRELDFLRLINPNNFKDCWRSRVFPSQEPILPTEKLNPDDRVCIATYYRPDLRQAQLDLANGDLDVLHTENGLLPALDFVLNSGSTGKGDTFGQAFRQTKDLDFTNWTVGFQFSYPLQNRVAKAAYRRANFSRLLAEESIRNFEQIIEVDVRRAIINIDATARLIDSTRVTSRLRAETLAAENEKFRVGRSTALLVAQAQRDLTTAQLDEITAVVANVKSYIQLYRVEGTALQRVGIQPIMINPSALAKIDHKE